MVPPSNLSLLSPNDSLDIAKMLTNNSQKISKDMAMHLGKNIPKTQNLNGISAIASGTPIECFNNTNSSDLVNLIKSMDLINMNSNKKNFIAAKVAITLN